MQSITTRAALRRPCRLCAHSRHHARPFASTSNQRLNSSSNHAGPSTPSPAFHSTLTSLRKPHLDFPALLASPEETTRNHVLRRVRLPLGKDHVHRMVQLKERQGELYAVLGEIKTQQKALGARIGQDPKNEAVRNEARESKGQAGSVQTELDGVEAEILDLGLLLPNWSHSSSPIGPEENAKEVLRFGPDSMPADKSRDHLTLCNAWNLLDNEASNHTSGSSWPFLKGFLAQLEMALINHSLSIATAHGFAPVITPDAVRGDIAWRCGFQPRDPENGATQIYQLHTDPGTPEMCLTGTAEIPLAGLFANKTFGIRELPSKVVGIGRSFRAEAGATGQDTRGLYRVHQFTKVEMFVVSEREQSEVCFEELGRIQREIVEPLGVPVRVLEMPTEELGASAARKWDMEAWMPGRGRWGEITSTSNCTDYQSRRLHIRYRPVQMPTSSIEKQPTLAFAHTLNGTAAAIPRLIIALLENGARFDDRGGVEGVDLPECLRRFWIGTEEIGLGKERGSIKWV